jgi:hypothetical protein
MGRRSCQATETAVAALAAIILLSATAAATDPNKPSSKEAKLQVAAKPAVSKAATPPKPTGASFTREMPFGEAIDILKKSTTPPLNIVVLWKEVGENAGVYRETPIGIDGVPGLRAGQYLELLLLSLSGSASARLGYTVKDGVITVGTTGSLRAPKRVTRVYDISDLVAEPARYSLPWMGLGGMGYGGMGYGGMYGGSMVGPTGGYGYGDRGLANGVGSLYQSARQPGVRRR